MVTCGDCGQTLATVTKDKITQEDVDNYQASCSCDADEQDNIVVNVLN